MIKKFTITYWKLIITIANTVGIIVLFVNMAGNDTRGMLLAWIIILPVVLFTYEGDSDDLGHGGYA